MAQVEIPSPPSSADPLVFKIKAATLKFETQKDIEPYLKPLIETPHVEEVHLSGNTYGVEACKFIGQVLSTKKALKVSVI
jgi:Ran GTPase-activating protein 1